MSNWIDVSDPVASSLVVTHHLCCEVVRPATGVRSVQAVGMVSTPSVPLALTMWPISKSSAWMSIPDRSTVTVAAPPAVGVDAPTKVGAATYLENCTGGDWVPDGSALAYSVCVPAATVQASEKSEGEPSKHLNAPST